MRSLKVSFRISGEAYARVLFVGGGGSVVAYYMLGFGIFIIGSSQHGGNWDFYS
jgi:hypothetical protein